MATIKPYQGESGYLCLPLVSNILAMGKAAKPNDWDVIKCPNCGEECYLSPDAKELLDSSPQLQGVCTVCALSMGGRQKDAYRH